MKKIKPIFYQRKVVYYFFNIKLVVYSRNLLIFSISFLFHQKRNNLKKRFGDKNPGNFAKYIYTSILNLQGTSSCFQSVKIVNFDSTFLSIEYSNVARGVYKHSQTVGM